MLCDIRRETKQKNHKKITINKTINNIEYKNQNRNDSKQYKLNNLNPSSQSLFSQHPPWVPRHRLWNDPIPFPGRLFPGSSPRPVIARTGAGIWHISPTSDPVPIAPPPSRLKPHSAAGHIPTDLASHPYIELIIFTVCYNGIVDRFFHAAA